MASVVDPMDAQSTTLGLIAGAGQLPADVASAARKRGHRVVAIALRGCCDPALLDDVDELHWLDIGELESLFKVFRSSQVSDAVMAGKVSKARLFPGGAGAKGGELKLDARAARVLASLADRSDDSILGAIADELSAEGIRLRSQAELVPELLAGEGPIGECVPTSRQWSDIEFGFGVAKALGQQDIGQTVVVKHRAVVAVEAIEGTDETIRRGAELAGPGASVVKVSKPTQDPRFDLPAIGPETLQSMQRGAVAALAFEAGATLVLNRSELARAADAAGIAVVGVSSQSLAGRVAGAD